MADVEQLLRSALVPIDPPASLSEHLEKTLSEVTNAAAEELGEWELEHMRDPRNWARPVIATAAVGIAGASLVLVRARRASRRREAHGLNALEQSLGEVLGQVRRRL